MLWNRERYPDLPYVVSILFKGANNEPLSNLFLN
jgi:hypothetical protein